MKITSSATSATSTAYRRHARVRERSNPNELAELAGALNGDLGIGKQEDHKPRQTIDLHIEGKAAKRRATWHLLTYKTRDAANADRSQQMRLLDILDTSPAALSRDECGAWRVRGPKGHVYSWGDGTTWVAYVAPGSSTKWTNLKQRLSFCQITQNGDDEGCLRFGPIVTKEQGRILRKALGLRQRRTLSPERREILVSAGAKFLRGKSGLPAPKTVETPSGVPTMPSLSKAVFGSEMRSPSRAAAITEVTDVGA